MPRIPVLLIPVVAFVAALACASWFVPKSLIDSTRDLELALAQSMAGTLRRIRSFDQSSFTVAVTTIGKLGYDLPGCRVIDMLGLTDSTIARHPETIAGTKTTWKERNLNATYVLEQEPDYIVFSTGYKPSAPAERALLLHKRFRRGYYGIMYLDDDGIWSFFRRKPGPAVADELWPDNRFAHLVNEAFNAMKTQDYRLIASRFIEAHNSGPGDFAMLLAFAADAFHTGGELERALVYADSALVIDSASVEAWMIRRAVVATHGDTTAFIEATETLNRLAPGVLDW